MFSKVRHKNHALKKKFMAQSPSVSIDCDTALSSLYCLWSVTVLQCFLPMEWYCVTVFTTCGVLQCSSVYYLWSVTVFQCLLPVECYSVGSVCRGQDIKMAQLGGTTEMFNVLCNAQCAVQCSLGRYRWHSWQCSVVFSAWQCSAVQGSVVQCSAVCITMQWEQVGETGSVVSGRGQSGRTGQLR